MGRPRTVPLLSASLAWLCACAPCPSIEQASVWDPRDKATPEQVLEIQHAMADFAAWTGVSELCVLGVKILPLIRPEVGGIYAGPGTWISMDPLALEGAAQVTRHELCHAYDDAGGWVSGGQPEVFLAEDVERSFAYWTDRERIRESFAHSCGKGPFDLGLELGIEQACGVELLPRRRRWVMENVYVYYEPSWPWLGARQTELERLRLDRYDHVDVFVGAGNWLFGLVAEERAGVGHAMAPPPEDEGAPQTDLHQGHDDFVVRLDPNTGREIDRVALDGIERGRNNYFRLLGGRDKPLLIAVDAERTRAWRVDTKAGALVEMKMPRLGYSKGIGAARGDRAWLVGTLANDPMVRPIEVDLRTGAWRVIDCDDSGAEGLDLEAIQDLGDDLLLWHRGGSTEDLVRYDPDDGSCVRQPLPVYSEVETQGVAELDDGRQVLLLHAAAADNSLIELLAVHDPAEGGWRTDPTECSPGWHDDALNHIGWRDTTLIALGGRVSFPTWVTEEDGSAQWELVHVRLP